MILQRLAAKQKRYLDICHTLQSSTAPDAASAPLRETLARYKEMLGVIWSKQDASPEDLNKLDSLERQLETLSNEVRLNAKSGAVGAV